MSQLIAFGCGAMTCACLSYLTIVILIRLDLIRKVSHESELRARVESCFTLTEGRCKASEDFMKREIEDCRAGILNLTAHVDKLTRELLRDDRRDYHSDEIPSGREVIGGVEGVGHDG